MPSFDSASPTRPAWEQNIVAHTELSVLAITSGQLDDLRSFAVAQHTAMLLAADPPPSADVRAKLQNINEGTLQDVQASSQECKQTVEGLKGTTPNKPAWEATINDANEKTIQNFAKQVRAAGKNAIDYINTLPPTQQNGAATAYGGAMSLVNTAINTVSKWLGQWFDSVKDFLAGIWNSITTVWNGVKDTVVGAAQSIANFFGGIFTLAAFIPGASVAAGEVPHFVGQLAWPLSIGWAVAGLQVEAIIKLLGHDGLGVAYQHLDMEYKSGKEGAIIGSIKFGPYGKDSPQISSSDTKAGLSMKFAQAVQEMITTEKVAPANQPSLMGQASGGQNGQDEPAADPSQNGYTKNVDDSGDANSVVGPNSACGNGAGQKSVKPLAGGNKFVLRAGFANMGQAM